MADNDEIQERLSRKIYREHDTFLIMARDLEPSFDNTSMGRECRFEQEARLSLYRQALKVVNYIEAYRDSFWTDGNLRGIEDELRDYLKDEDFKIVQLLSSHENVVRIANAFFENRSKIGELIDKMKEIGNQGELDSQKGKEK